MSDCSSAMAFDEIKNVRLSSQNIFFKLIFSVVVVFVNFFAFFLFFVSLLFLLLCHFRESGNPFLICTTQGLQMRNNGFPPRGNDRKIIDVLRCCSLC
jgi:hypothetical protein